MCFSAQASFTAAAGLSLAGGVSLYVSRGNPRSMLFAAIPCLFALHQLIEGLLWLEFQANPYSPQIKVLSYSFALIAFCVWPVVTPISVLLMECNPFRRKLLRGCVVIGIVVGIYLVYFLYQNGVIASVVQHSIRYRFRFPLRLVFVNLYGIAVTGSCLMSSHRWVRIFGAALAVSYYFSFFVYRATYESVWCYFAAVLSVCVLLHLRHTSVAKA